MTHAPVIDGPAPDESLHADLELRLIDKPRSRHFLFVLDNFEHVLSAAPVVTALVVGCPDLKILVTSQGALHLRGERELLVGPLDTPASGSMDLHVGGDKPLSAVGEVPSRR